MKRLLRHTIFLLLTLTALTACRDEFPLTGTLGEGMATLHATVDFKPMASALTRSDGKALSEIDYLYLLLYDAETKELTKKIAISMDDLKTDKDEENYKDSLREENAEEQIKTKHAHFTLWEKIPYGQYYMYAVANVKNLIYEERYADDILTADGLKNILLDWDEKEITHNGEMLGYFTTDTSAPDSILRIDRSAVNIRASLRRAASKVTVAYDGSKLNDDVTIHFLAVSIKDIPRTCLLGNDNTPTASDQLIHDGESIKYFSADDYPALADYMAKDTCKVDKAHPLWPKSAHLDAADALYFYENMQGQGPDKRQKDTDRDGNLDYVEKDSMNCGTYIEVDAIYVSTSETGIVKYRFMLGKDIIKDYNAERNYHYKLTLHFNGTAKDPDWHIEYQEQVFEVSQPKVMNYLGKVFVPEYSSWIKNYNLGHTFDYTSVTVSSYIKGSDVWVPWKMEYSTDEGKTFTEARPDWLECDTIDGYLPYVKNIRFRVKELNVKEVDIDTLLQKADNKGSETAPYNLADPKQGNTAPESATIENTANCYMVDAPGWYLLPLVYGNAIKDGDENPSAYKAGEDSDTFLGTFRDYLGKPISSPYIQNLDDENYTPKSAFLLWQDKNNLINYSVWKHTWAIPTFDIEYLPNAYEGHGGIKFRIQETDIQQGNAVIALGTDTVKSSDLPSNFPPIMWSWHIWVTNFGFLQSDDETIEVTGHNADQKFRLLPVNLGWCSGQNEPIKYYEARKCQVRFSVSADNFKTITLEQKSHIAVTRGTSPYFQWGRKDPFVGATGNNINNRRYVSKDWYWDENKNPDMLFSKETPNDRRSTTQEALADGLLIQKPHLWHNPLRTENDSTLTGDSYAFRSLNKTYTNLWRQPDGAKTVYDPCPVGYQVPPQEAFSGFTTTGKNTNTDFEWYDVRLENIAEYDAETGVCGKDGMYSNALYEFYTNPDKLQSIVIPESGYRDWDDEVCAYKVNAIGYLWTATYNSNPNGNHKDIFNLEFSRKDDKNSSYIRPENRFYSCDGFPIRPLKTSLP